MVESLFIYLVYGNDDRHVDESVCKNMF